MSLSFSNVVLNVQDLQKSKNFWKEALGFVVKTENYDWIKLVDPHKDWARFCLQLTDKPKKELNRIHFDLVAEDGGAEVERLLDLGASVLPWKEYEPDSDFIVMTDTEGNEFCVVAEDATVFEKYRVKL